MNKHHASSFAALAGSLALALGMGGRVEAASAAVPIKAQVAITAAAPRYVPGCTAWIDEPHSRAVASCYPTIFTRGRQFSVEASCTFFWQTAVTSPWEPIDSYRTVYSSSCWGRIGTPQVEIR